MRRRVSLAALLVLAFLCASAARVEASDVWVTSTADSGPGSLRQAIADADSGDIVRLDPALSYRTITLASQLVIDKDLVIDGLVARDVQISGNNATRLFDIGANGTSCGIQVVLSDLRLVSGSAESTPSGEYGSGIRTCAGALLINAVSFEHMVGLERGGAIYQSDGFTNLRDTQIVDAAGNSGAAVMAVGGAMIFERVTISSSVGDGSVLHFDNTFALLDTVTLYDTETTISGPLVIGNGSAVEMQNSTIAGNRNPNTGSAQDADIIVTVSDSTLDVRNSIVANPGYTNCSSLGSGVITDLGNNLQFGDTTCGFTTTADPEFGVFGVYGSLFVPTLPIAETSPARNAGDNGSCPAFDGRLLFRDADGVNPCDIGAFEWDGPLSATVINLDDSGAGSLRQTLLEVGSGARVTFDPDLTGTLLIDSPVALERSVTLVGPGMDLLTIKPSAIAGPIPLMTTGGAFCEEVIALRGFTFEGGTGDDFTAGALSNCTVLTVEDVRFTANAGTTLSSAFYTCCGATVMTRVRFDNNAAGPPAAFMDSPPWVVIRDSSLVGNAETIHIDDALGVLLRNVTASGTGGTRLFATTEQTSLEHVTFSGDLLLDNNGAPMSVANSILAGGTGACVGDGFESRGHNVIEGECPQLLGDGSSVQAAPLLAPVAINAPGTVATRGLMPTSPAIDFADAAFCPPMDARGFERPQAAACDAGAFEAHIVTLSPGAMPSTWLNLPFTPTTLSTTGTFGAATYAMTAGALPPGLVFNAGSATFTGTPTLAGTYGFTITVMDDSGVGVAQPYTLIVDGLPTVTNVDNKRIARNGALGPVPLTVGDDVIAPTALLISASSSNQALVPDANITFAGSGTSRTLSVTPIADAFGVTTITVTVSDGVLSTTTTFALTVMPVYYLAEGATGPFFDLDLLLANPNGTTLPIDITFLKDDGTSIVQSVTLAATSRTTIRVDDIAGLEAAALSTIVTSTTGGPLVVERTMRWDASGYGAHTEKATAGVAPTWYFAEGSQGYFSTFILLANPDPQPNTAHVIYFRDGGAGPVARDYALPPTSRVTIDAGDDPALANQSFGARVTFDRPGVAERAMYFGSSPMFAGGTASAGANAPATSWFLAEGATGSYFTTFLLLANPNVEDASVDVTYFPADGVPVTKTYTVAGNGRATINIALEDASLASAAVATRVESTRPIVAERSQYWPQPDWIEAHNSFGVTATGTKWGLAEGRVGGTTEDQTYILLANPGAAAADVTITFLRADGTTLVKAFAVPPTSRRNVAVTGVGSDVPELVDEAFGAIIASTQPIAVERSMYSNANGVTWSAGTNATATRLR